MKILKIITKISIFNKDIIQYHMWCLFSKTCVINANDIFIYKIKMGKLFFFVCILFGLVCPRTSPHPTHQIKMESNKKKVFQYGPTILNLARNTGTWCWSVETDPWNLGYIENFFSHCLGIFFFISIMSLIIQKLKKIKYCILRVAGLWCKSG